LGGDVAYGLPALYVKVGSNDPVDEGTEKDDEAEAETKLEPDDIEAEAMLEPDTETELND
jgi:hypothetical protein